MKNRVIGLDIGGTMIKGALFDARGSAITKDSATTDPENAGPDFIRDIHTLVEKLRGPEKQQIDAVGIGIAGVIDGDRTILIESPNLPLLNNLHLKQGLEKSIGVPVFIENDANCAALGELWKGAGRDSDNFLLFTLGTGIGSGLILNGSLWAGEQGKAGEFGHTIVQPRGSLCGCGKRGCLEAHSSGRALKRMAVDALVKGENSALKKYWVENPALITPELIYQEAKKGDSLSRQIYEEAARYLAIGIANVNNLLDIHHFIVGGGISKGFDLFEKTLTEETVNLVFGVSKNKLAITVSHLGNDAGMYGAGFLAHST